MSVVDRNIAEGKPIFIYTLALSYKEWYLLFRVFLNEKKSLRFGNTNACVLI